MTNGIVPSALLGDTEYTAEVGGVALRFLMPYLLSAPRYTDLPAWWSPGRDAVLLSTLDREAMWAAAVGKVATKVAALGWTVKDSQDSDRRVKQAQELFLAADGEIGWVPFITKVMQDFLTCDNGCFVRIRTADEKAERVRVKAAEEPTYTDVILTASAPGAKVTGLYHLDSLACERTGVPGYPVRYRDMRGQLHLLRFDQVVWAADMPSPRQGMFGVGRCAASRAYPTISKLAAMEQLVYEALSGGGFSKLVLLNGMNDKTLKGLLESGKADAQAKGLVYYLGNLLAALPTDQPVTAVEVRLKELLTQFVPKEERDNGYLIYANSIGVAVQEIQPLSGQGLGTGTQSLILSESAKGTGVAAFLKWWAQTVSRRVLPKTTEFTWENEHDNRDQKEKAEVEQLRAQTRAARITSGEISPAMARQIALDDGDLAPELMPNDATAGGQLSDSEKPLELGAQSLAARLLAQGAPLTAPAQGQGLQRPALKDADLLARELEAARLLAEWANG